MTGAEAGYGRAAVLTVSDRCSRGEAEDRSGPAVGERCTSVLDLSVEHAVCPDDADAIAEQLRRWVAAGVDLVLTTGGTGFAPRDVTPEATRRVIERDGSQLLELARLRCFPEKPFAYLSRGVAGVAGSTLIINLPGSPRGAVEIFDHLVDQLPHLLRQIAGDADHGA